MSCDESSAILEKSIRLRIGTCKFDNSEFLIPLTLFETLMFVHKTSNADKDKHDHKSQIHLNGIFPHPTSTGRRITRCGEPIPTREHAHIHNHPHIGQLVLLPRLALVGGMVHESVYVQSAHRTCRHPHIRGRHDLHREGTFFIVESLACGCVMCV